MFVTLLSFILLTTIFFSVGSIFLYFWQKYIDRKLQTANYNLLDTTLIGLFGITLIVSILSFISPINEYILGVLAIPCIIYFSYATLTGKITISLQNVTSLLFITTALFLIFHGSFIIDTYDAKYYHLQHIESIYRHPIIKGFANVEDRYGFNSNMLLIHTLFSLKGVLGYHFFSLNPFLFFAVFLFILKNLYNKFNFFNLIALMGFIFIYLANGHLLCSTNPDITATIISYYFIIRLLQNRNSLTTFYLFATLIPCLLITVKISSAFFCLISLIPICALLKDKKYKVVICLLLVGFTIVSVWLGRNIFISGYLIYPYPTIDLFDVDWKVPETVALIQKEYIRDFAYYVFATNEGVILYELKKFLTTGRLLDFTILLFKTVFILLVFITPFTLIMLLKKYKEHKVLLSILSTLLIGFIFCFYQAPYLRFYLAYMVCLIIINLLYTKQLLLNKLKFIHSPFLKHKRVKSSILYIALLFFIILCLKNLSPNLTSVLKNKNTSILIEPQLDINSTRSYPEIRRDSLNKLEIFINQDSTTNDRGFTYDHFLSSSYTGIPCTNPADGLKIQHLKTIETRGDNVTSGFRTKKNGLTIFIKIKESL